MEKKFDLFKDLALKVKKVVVESNRNGKLYRSEYQGVIVPKWNDYNDFYYKDEFILYTIDGEQKEFRLNWVKIENTRIMDKKVKDKLDKFIEVLKEEYKLRLEIVKLKEEYKSKVDKLNQKINKKKNNKEKSFNDIVKAQGLIPQDVFEEEFLKLVKEPYNYSIYLNFNGSKLLGITLEKEVDLGRWLTNSDYDFIWNEYDNTVMIYHEDIPKSKDYQKIIKKYFKPVKISKLDKFKVEESFDACGGGDKGSADAYHKINLSFDKGIDVKKENIKEVAKYMKQLISKM